jgi:hypothetical protein
MVIMPVVLLFAINIPIVNADEKDWDNYEIILERNNFRKLEPIITYDNNPKSVLLFFYASLLRGDKRWEEVITPDDPSLPNVVPFDIYFADKKIIKIGIVYKKTYEGDFIFGKERRYVEGKDVYYIDADDAYILIREDIEIENELIAKNGLANIKLIDGLWKVDIIDTWTIYEDSEDILY